MRFVQPIVRAEVQLTVGHSCRPGAAEPTTFAMGLHMGVSNSDADFRG
jgi:hypothetical protein